jgi:hypothetical protein
MSGSPDAEYTEYVAARLSSLRRLPAVLCDDWQRAADLVQAAVVKLYVHWGRVQAASHTDAYGPANPSDKRPGRDAPSPEHRGSEPSIDAPPCEEMP